MNIVRLTCLSLALITIEQSLSVASSVLKGESGPSVFGVAAGERSRRVAGEEHAHRGRRRSGGGAVVMMMLMPVMMMRVWSGPPARLDARAIGGKPFFYVHVFKH